MAKPTTVPGDLKDRMKNCYDAIAHTYNAKLGNVLDNIRLNYVNRLLSLLKETGRADATLLELGCGAGVPSTKTFLDNPTPSIHVTANDLSTVQLDLARQHLADHVESGKVTLIPGDMLALDFPPRSFDAVTGFYSIIHLPRDEQVLLMQKIVGWLKPGGYFLANFADEEQESHVMEKWLGEEKGWTFWSGWGAEGSAKMVADAGLEVLVRETRESNVDATFLWVVARKSV
ncbi:methyltransferase domain-containing protein [Paraphaeosphaeria sporulosa]|uniref:Methyltransferase domain-containing protein n=1 Tax=Paraphaeosphaeria sporulosa TaxID=1460663 RepID=A0A177CZ11_9PLEO|nr:methyltransferase domain-containing protein [Paraphaeosphaeria sporulosa]OAG12152.1 methyltransferase domain-containing protein [Paraphaeosphaeria sporulosa]